MQFVARATDNANDALGVHVASVYEIVHDLL